MHEDVREFALPVVALFGAVVLFTLAAVAVPALLGVGTPAETPGPSAEFEVSYSTADDTLFIQHAGGDALGTDGTVRVEVTDQATGATETVVWTTPGDGNRLTFGDTIAVGQTGNDRSAAGYVSFDLDRGDTVAVVWAGTVDGARSEFALGTFTIGGTQDD